MQHLSNIGVSKNRGTSKWMVLMENDLGGHYFHKHPYSRMMYQVINFAPDFQTSNSRFHVGFACPLEVKSFHRKKLPSICWVVNFPYCAGVIRGWDLFLSPTKSFFQFLPQGHEIFSNFCYRVMKYDTNPNFMALLLKKNPSQLLQAPLVGCCDPWSMVVPWLDGTTGRKVLWKDGGFEVATWIGAAGHMCQKLELLNTLGNRYMNIQV